MADGNDRKRSRAEADSETTQKKKKVALNVAQKSIQATISSVAKLPASPPVVAMSPGISVPELLQFRAYEKLSTRSARRPDEGSRSRRVTAMALHTSSHHTLDYTAREEADKQLDQPLKHYVGIYDPESGQLQLVEAKKMAIRGVVRAQQAPEEAMKSQDNFQDSLGLRKQLGQEFGTRKAKKALDSITLNAIKAPNGANDPPKALVEADMVVMDSIADVTHGMATKEELQAAVDLAKPIPKMNVEARDIQDVFDPVQMIGGDVLNAVPVKDWQDTTKSGKAIMSWSSFIAHRVVRVAANESDVQRLRLLRYMSIAAAIYKYAKPGNVRGTLKIPPKKVLLELCAPASDFIVESIRRKFSDGGIMRKFHMDLLMTHCCAFSLIIDSFDTDTHDLGYDFSLKPQQLAQYFHEIGVRVRTTNIKELNRSVTKAKLTLPLDFPKIRNPGGRRR